MNKIQFSFLIIFSLITTLASAQTPPAWVNSLERAFPSNDWVAAVGTGSTRPVAEQAAMNALARAFKTDVASITQMSQRFDQIISEAGGKRTVSFDESKNYSQDVNVSTNIRGLIGVQTDHFQAKNGTHHVNARMNKKECAARYAATVRENTAVINRLLSLANRNPNSFDAYSALNYAASIAEITDNFQNILEVLDPAAVNSRPSYGTANAIKARMMEMASGVTIGIAVVTENQNDTALIRRALGSFFTDRGFKINEQGRGNLVLRANVRFESTAFDRLYASRFYFDAVLEIDRAAVFSFTQDDRASHNRETEARRLALRAVETSIKEGKFAADFEEWLGSLIE